ncbi:MAG: tRNA (adenosine(37)-N6)-dimethylallyltransferase MiaA [Candidatus Omnitrophica bacterium]|nr:tRNA (adenosine(37)-N6)-dimethylallyltransferase MiaA [Candidatus Omnitrophota bacterium]
MNKPLVIFLVGPTASGKSDIALELAVLINGEIISADSMQVYRGMDILSAKPEQRMREKIPHHLIDCLDANEEYSAAVFRERALKQIEDIHKRDKIPLIAGGTGLYVKTLARGIFSDKGKDEQLRKDLAKELKEKGKEQLYARLKLLDPASAEKIHPNDTRRIIRALEVYEVNQVPLSALKNNKEGMETLYTLKMFAVEWQRSILYQRIETRIDQMLEQGLVEEVKRLKDKQLSHTAEHALGIKQISAYLKEECSLEQAVNFLKRDTRRFAKRQMTWFRADKGIVWISADDDKSAFEIAKEIQGKLS